MRPKQQFAGHKTNATSAAKTLGLALLRFVSGVKFSNGSDGTVQIFDGSATSFSNKKRCANAAARRMSGMSQFLEDKEYKETAVLNCCD
jgi:hypothetical protein